MRSILQDGRWIRVEDRRTADGGRVSVRTDITERKRNEVKNREQKQQLDAAVDNMVQGLVMVDADDLCARAVAWFSDFRLLEPDPTRPQGADTALPASGADEIP